MKIAITADLHLTPRKELPDLFPVKGIEPLFVEVKATREKVNTAQQAWHEYLAEEVHARIELCRVTET